MPKSVVSVRANAIEPNGIAASQAEMNKHALHTPNPFGLIELIGASLLSPFHGVKGAVAKLCQCRITE